MNPSHSLLHELHLLTLFGVHTPARCRNSINMLDKLKRELVPAAGDKLVLKLSPPPPLADKQVCVNLQWLREGVCTRAPLQRTQRCAFPARRPSRVLWLTGVSGGQHGRRRL